MHRTGALVAALVSLSLIAARDLAGQCVYDVSTGFDQAAGVVLAEGVPDDEYTFDFGFGSVPALSGGPGTGFPIPPWIANDVGSLWVSSSASSVDAPGVYRYEIRFTLPADPAPGGLALIGRFATDDGGVDVIINDTPTGIRSNGFVAYTDFPPDTGLGFFLPGENTIAFVLENGGAAPNPTGLRVDACVGTEAPPMRPFDISSGFDESVPRVLGDGAADDDYTVTGPPGSGIDGAAATTVPADGFPIPPWLPNSVSSRWIGLAADDSSGPAGVYTYRIAVTLPPEFDAARGVLSGGLAADERVEDVAVNGTSTGMTAEGSGALVLFPQGLGQGLFRSGSNTIELSVANDDGGPTGLRVDGEVVLGPPPCPAVPALFSIDTGFDDNAGAAIPNGLDDDSFIVIGPPGSGVGPTCASVVPDNQFPIGPWIASSAQSKWVGLAAGASSGPPGVYTFRVHLEVPPGVDAALLRIAGSWTSDNAALDVLVNGTSTGVAQGGNFTALTPFPAAAGFGLFQTGPNTIDFLVDNAPPGVNPVGLRVEAVVGTSLSDPSDLSSGVGQRGIGLLPPGFADPRYSLSGPGIGPQPAVVVGSLAPGWLGNSDRSRWVGLNGADSDGPPGRYTYTVTFSLPTEFNPARAIVSGGWTAAARGADVLLNDVPLGVPAPDPGALASFDRDFPQSAGLGHFVPGQNTLAYLVDATSPTGLRVEAGLAQLVVPNRLDISTGFDEENGAVLAGGAADPDYTVTDPDSSLFEATVTPDGVAPIPPWIANTASSRWLGVELAGAASPGRYSFQTTVELTEAEAATARIAGVWAADDRGADVLINKVSTGAATIGAFVTYTPFPPDFGRGLFTAGPNIIEFLVDNDGLTPNPSGLRVDAVVEVDTMKLPVFVRGDADSNGRIELTDAVRILNFLFLGLGSLPCADAADADDNGRHELTDAVRVLNYLFLGTGRIPAPSPSSAVYVAADCGADPTEEAPPLGCEMASAVCGAGGG
jgi:hypothetical protein